MSIITDQEFSLRLQKIQKLMVKKEINGLFCTLGKNFQYILKSPAKPLERLTLGIIPASGEPLLVLPSFEKLNFLETTPLSDENLHTWEEVEDPFKLVKKVSTKSISVKGTIAISPQTPFTIFNKIKSLFPAVDFIDGGEIFEMARIKKTSTEIDLLKKASEFSARGIEAAFDQLKEGMTELELSEIVKKEMTQRSGEPADFAIVQFGENSANPHGLPTKRKLKKGDVVLIDAGTSYQGYVGDITNTTVFGTPSEKFLEIYNIVEKANQKGVESGKQGSTGAQIDAVTREVITSAKYGDFFTHRTGHGIGLDVHEAPYIVGTNKIPLELNNSFTIEPGIYLPNNFGVRIEDDVVVGKDSGLRLSTPIRRYWEQ